MLTNHDHRSSDDVDRSAKPARRWLSMALAGALVAGVVGLGAAPAAAHRAVRPTEWNDSSDPNALYGLCAPSGSHSGMRSVYLGAAGINETLAGVLKITILQCGESGSVGATGKVRCPTGAPYAYCYAIDNDGGGNGYVAGVLKVNATTNPRQSYGGCPSGVATKPKIELLIGAGRDPRVVSGIVTLSCRSGTGPATPATLVDCPSGPHPYAYCLGTPNDGRGTAVTIGVVGANGPHDPYGLYGECNTSDFGVMGGFKRKSTLVQSVGREVGKAASIIITTCRELPGAVPPVREVSCDLSYFRTYQQLGWTFDYCLEGRDSLSNFVRAGVLTRP